MIQIIAEIGSNFCTSEEQTEEEKFNRAIKLIASASQYGASAVKFQMLKADELYRDPPEELYERELPPRWLDELHACAEDHGVEFLCTPFYLDAVDILDGYVSRWKIASWDITWRDLLEKIATTEKPVIMSCGAATPTEVSNALKVWDEYHGSRTWISRNNNMTLLHCTPSYPTDVAHAGLERISFLRSWFAVRVGLSSHIRGDSEYGDYTEPVLAAIASSVALGGEVIEVHYDGDGRGVEAGHSLIAEDLWALRDYVNAIEQAMHISDGYREEYDEAVRFARKNYRRGSDGLRPVI